MGDSVTSHESWTSKNDDDSTPCWNCKTGKYLVYASDATQASRCGQCGELEQDAPSPAKVTRSIAAPKTGPAKRAYTKPKDKA